MNPITPEHSILICCSSNDATLGDLRDRLCLDGFLPATASSQGAWLFVQKMLADGTVKQLVDGENNCMVYRLTDAGKQVLEQARSIVFVH